jgi:putative sigma-54 modulation protein
MQQLDITGHHVEITDALRSYVQEKMERLVRHGDGIGNAHVVLNVEPHQRQQAEATMHVSGADLHAEAESDDLYAAIDALVDKLDRQLTKHRDKMNDKHHGKG